ncbi:MAG: glycosyltransferase family protein [Gammaproteobacteria bacterium]|nr:glycosyltransferase family protein [Gammaproteobacteria bacterium]MBU1732213.1 glycosyltransferase family protein [Gammaproteobacteria bacterium]MBU1893257.1 glycosyltransferase family protein [Gammaproteobacteria bacterium]
MNTAIIVQARMTSTRLPGKILKQVLGKPLLEYQLERLRRSRLTDGIVIATTTNETDQPIVDWCERHDVACFRGSEHDVLARYHGAAVLCHADTVVRVTSDCPLIDPAVIDEVIDYYRTHITDCDYASNCLERSYPRGMDVEVFSRRTLDEAFAEAKDSAEREHVTPFIYRHPERYRLANIAYLEDQGRHRWTVDTQEDFELVEKILSALYPAKPTFTLEDVLDMLQQHPDWADINAHVEQKKLGQ